MDYNELHGNPVPDSESVDVRSSSSSNGHDSLISRSSHRFERDYDSDADDHYVGHSSSSSSHGDVHAEDGSYRRSTDSDKKSRDRDRDEPSHKLKDSECDQRGLVRDRRRDLSEPRFDMAKSQSVRNSARGGPSSPNPNSSEISVPSHGKELSQVMQEIASLMSDLQRKTDRIFDSCLHNVQTDLLDRVNKSSNRRSKPVLGVESTSVSKPPAPRSAAQSVAPQRPIGQSRAIPLEPCKPLVCESLSRSKEHARKVRSSAKPEQEVKSLSVSSPPSCPLVVHSDRSSRSIVQTTVCAVEQPVKISQSSVLQAFVEVKEMSCKGQVA